MRAIFTGSEVARYFERKGQMRMANLNAVLKQLQYERDDLQHQIRRLDSALHVLSGLDHSGRGRGGRRNVSAAGRARIAAAQRARWAAWKAKHK